MGQEKQLPLTQFCPIYGSVMSLSMQMNKTFSIESTLATKSYKNLIERAQGKGYQVKLLFFWLDSPQTAIERVAQRVREGGHSIPSDIIIRRYYAGIKNLFNIYMNCVDYWVLANNTNGSSEYIAEGGKGTDSNIFDSETYNKVLHYVRG